MAADGPVGTVEIETQRLNATIALIDSTWNARRHAIAVQLGALRDAALSQAGKGHDYDVAAALFAITDAAQSTFLDGTDVVGSASDTADVKDAIKTAPKIAGDVAQKIVDDANARASSFWNALQSALSSLWLTPVVLLALLAAIGIGWYFYKENK